MAEASLHTTVRGAPLLRRLSDTVDLQGSAILGVDTGSEHRPYACAPVCLRCSRGGLVSQAAVGEILARSLRDRSFADLLKADPEAVLIEFDLTDDERASIVAGLRGHGGGAQLEQRPRMAGRIV